VESASGHHTDLREKQLVLRSLYDWTLSFASKPYALWALAFFAFIEASVFPLPPDILMIPMILAARKKAWLIATICTLFTSLGGLAGYGVGYLLYESIGTQILAFYGYADKFVDFKNLYNDYGTWIVIGGGLTPFPYKVITIASGVAEMNIWLFFVSSVIGRALRFFLVAGLLWYFGPFIKNFIEKYLGWLTLIFFIVLIGGFAALKLL
jgi:membrane protein YqaA with SNARE-associated domain